MKLWQRLGVDPGMLNKEDLEKNVRKSLEKTTYLKGVPTQKSWAVSMSSFAACCCYVLEDIEDTKRYGRISVDAAVDYFYSDWREKVPTDEKTIDPSWWKKRHYWYDEFWYSVLWAMCLDMWDIVLKIAQYPDMECYSERTRGSPEIAYRLLLAAVIREENLEDYQVLVDEIEKGLRKKEKLLWAVLKAIVDKDEAAFDKAFLEYLKYYKKRETIHHGINNLTRDGTILFNLAKHKNLDVEFPEKYRDHYICLK